MRSMLSKVTRELPQVSGLWQSPISDTDRLRMVVMELLTNEDVLRKMNDFGDVSRR